MKLVIFALIPLILSIGIIPALPFVDLIPEADALKGQGVGSAQYGSVTRFQVCGGMLCSEYPGGYEQFQKDQGKSSSVEVLTRVAPAQEKPEVCTMQWDPVCSVDGKTYGNMCMLRVAEAGFAYSGECIPQKPEVCTTQWDPVCGLDGKTYSNLCMLEVAEAKFAYSGECKVRGIEPKFELEKSITPVVSGGTMAITSTPIIGITEKSYPANYIPGNEKLDENEIRLTFLGTGMPFPTKSQAAAGLLMEFGNGEILMFDVGSGTVANFNSMKISPADLTKFFITHLHTDHQGDFDMFWAQGLPFGRILPMQVWGPTGDGHALGTQAFVEGTLAANYWDLKSRTGTIPTTGAEVITHEFDWAKTQVVYEENGITVTSFPAIHAMAGAVSYRIDWNGMSIVYSGDTRINNFMVEQGQNVNLLIHETFLPAEIFSQKTGMDLESAKRMTNEIHTSAKAAGVIFELTKPRMAVMYHTWVTEETITPIFDELRIPYLGPVTLAQDFTVFNITPESIVVRQALVDNAPWPIIPAESSHAEKSQDIPVLPQWLLDQAIDVDEAIAEIQEKRIK